MQPGDFQNGTWKRLKAHMEARLKELRELNDGLNNDERKTALIRGEISGLKRLLALPQAAPASDGDPDFVRVADRS